MKKIKIHIRNNHWKEGFLPCDAEGEKNNTITKEEIEKGFDQYPESVSYTHLTLPTNREV